MQSHPGSTAGMLPVGGTDHRYVFDARYRRCLAIGADGHAVGHCAAAPDPNRGRVVTGPIPHLHRPEVVDTQRAKIMGIRLTLLRLQGIGIKLYPDAAPSSRSDNCSNNVACSWRPVAQYGSTTHRIRRASAPVAPGSSLPSPCSRERRHPWSANCDRSSDQPPRLLCRTCVRQGSAPQLPPPVRCRPRPSVQPNPQEAPVK